ncbi:MAG: hypothetical protein NVS9B5_22270 [Terriglobales bacterium]
MALSGGGSSSIELALDLVLNEIVQEARAETKASGAAIALVRDGTMVCRATTGTGGPNLGTLLDEESGLSGISLRTREVQRCNDCEADPRVDAVACRAIGVRSVLVVPIETEIGTERPTEVLGIIETFSPRPNAFDDNDVQTLRALCSQIVGYVVVPGAHAANSGEVEVQRLAADDVAPSAVPAQIEQNRLDQEDSQSRNAYWTTFLTAAVIGCAFLLGWALGGGNSNAQKSSARSVRSSMEPTAEFQNDRSAAQDINSPTQAEAKLPTATQREDHGQVPAGGLVVYEKGKVIFRTQSGGLAPVPRSQKRVADGALAGRTPRVIRNVAPIYPELAKQKHIQGPVEVATTVDGTGMVEKAAVISGDPILAASAITAISQWRFEPLVKDGKPTKFETRIKVAFRLP